MEDRVLCTLDELTRLVGSALAVDYPGAPTARVRDVPDQRAIRWYVTRGLVDRPLATRGRVALYGRRHLLQLVAIKRRQADGRSLAEIQAELAGATDDRLAEVARLADLVGGKGRPNAPDLSRPDVRPDAGERAAQVRARFWADRPRPTAATASVLQAREAGQGSAEAGPDGGRVHADGLEAGADAGTGADPGTEAVALRGVRLAPGITLLIEDWAGDSARHTDLAAIRAAARPLLDLLAAGGHAPHAPQTPDEE